jgi:hypothetical protein
MDVLAQRVWQQPWLAAFWFSAWRMREQLSAYVGAAAIALVFTGGLGRVLRRHD